MCYIYRPNSDFFIIYNQSTGAGLERPSYSLQFKLTRDFVLSLLVRQQLSQTSLAL